MLAPDSSEVMRHVPSPQFLARKLDGDVRRAISIFKSVPDGRGSLSTLDSGLRRVARLLNVEPPAAADISTLLDAVVSALRSREETQFRRRTPEDRFVRGKGERIWSCSTGLLATVQRLLEDSAGRDGSVILTFYADSLPALPELAFTSRP